MERICAEIEAIDQAKKQQTSEQQNVCGNKATKPKRKRVKSQNTVSENIVNESLMANKESKKHTCYSGEKTSKIVNMSENRRMSTRKCNVNSRVNKTKRAFVSESTKCECDGKVAYFLSI